MADYIDRVVTEDGEMYALSPVMDDELTDISDKPVPSGLVYDFINAILAPLPETIQTKILEEAIDFHGTILTDVVTALRTIAYYYSSLPVQNGTQFFTAGGAYSDKASTPVSGSTKNFTAGGAYADKTDIPAYGDNRCITAAGAYAWKTAYPERDSLKFFTAKGAMNFFISGDFENFLEIIFGYDYAYKVSNGYFVE